MNYVACCSLNNNEISIPRSHHGPIGSRDRPSTGSRATRRPPRRGRGAAPRRRRFGRDQPIVGREISLNGTGYTVLGVLPAGFTFPFRDAEMAVLLQLDSHPRRGDRGAGFLRVAARLKPGVSIERAKADLDTIGKRLQQMYPEADAQKTGVNLFPLSAEM